MLNGWGFFGALAVIVLLIVIFSMMAVSSEQSRQEEIEAWEREHSKERDGSGV